MTGHNSLADIAANVSAIHQEIDGHNRQAFAKALQVGRLLNDAKLAVGHGSWGEWLVGTGMGERTAQR